MGIFFWVSHFFPCLPKKWFCVCCATLPQPGLGWDPRYIVIGPNNEVIIADLDWWPTICMFRSDGSLLTTFSLPSETVYNIAVNLTHMFILHSRGRIDTVRLSSMDNTGQFFARPEDEELQLPFDSLTASNNEVFVASCRDGEICVFDLDGTFLRRWTKCASALAFGPEGLYVACGDHLEVQVCRPDGTVVRSIDAGRLWLEGRKFFQKRGKTLDLTSLSVSSSGQVLVTGETSFSCTYTHFIFRHKQDACSRRRRERRVPGRCLFAHGRGCALPAWSNSSL